MGIPLALYVAINEIKFDTPFSIPFNRQVYSLENAHRQAVLASNGGSLFGLKYLAVRPAAVRSTRRPLGHPAVPMGLFPRQGPGDSAIPSTTPGTGPRASRPACRCSSSWRWWASSWCSGPPDSAGRDAHAARRIGTGRDDGAVGGTGDRRAPTSARGGGGRNGRHLDLVLHRRALPGRCHAAPVAGRARRLALRVGSPVPNGPTDPRHGPNRGGDAAGRAGRCSNCGRPSPSASSTSESSARS